MVNVMIEKRVKINSLDELQKKKLSIIRSINKDQNLALRAFANPLLALEEMGYDIAPDVQKDVERFLRFRPHEYKRLKELEKRVHTLAGHAFDLDSIEEVEAVLFRDLKLSKQKGMQRLGPPDIFEMGAALAKGRKLQWSDPLEPLKKAHPIMDPLLAYRKLATSRPGFATKSLYMKLKTGERKLPISNIRILEDNEEVKNA